MVDQMFVALATYPENFFKQKIAKMNVEINDKICTY